MQESFPVEILCLILDYSNTVDVIKYRRCCKIFNEAAIRLVKDFGINVCIESEILRVFRNLTHARLGDSVTDSDLKDMHLEVLCCLKNTRVTDEGIRNQSLKMLHCGENPNFTDDGIRGSCIEVLYCGKSKFTDDAIRSLPLKVLNRGNSEITDEMLTEKQLTVTVKKSEVGLPGLRSSGDPAWIQAYEYDFSKKFNTPVNTVHPNGDHVAYLKLMAGVMMSDDYWNTHIIPTRWMFGYLTTYYCYCDRNSVTVSDAVVHAVMYMELLTIRGVPTRQACIGVPTVGRYDGIFTNFFRFLFAPLRWFRMFLARFLSRKFLPAKTGEHRGFTTLPSLVC